MVSIQDNPVICSDGLQKKKIDDALRAGVPTAATGSDPACLDGSPGKAAGIDKKEVAAWKLPDQISKADFRHWIDAVDLQLEAVHGLPYPELILDKIRR